MNRFIPREKLSKKARKKLDSEKRAGWTFSPVSRRVESKKCTAAMENPMTVIMITGMGFFMEDCPSAL